MLLCRTCSDCAWFDYEARVEASAQQMRPAEVDVLLGDASSCRTVLGWEPETRLEAMAQKMFEADFRRLEKRGAR